MMLALAQSLQGHDLGHLRIIAEMWGVDLEAVESRTAPKRLAGDLLNPPLVEEVIADLPGEARSALDDLLQNDGFLPWPLFSRRYGTIREMGPARRDRDRPHLHPASPAEMLWYRGLVGRTFKDTPAGPQEFAYIPTDLLALLPPPPEAGAGPMGRLASAAEQAHPVPADDSILDHACTLLAALRLGLPLPEAYLPAGAYASGSRAAGLDWSRPSVIPARDLQSLLSAAGLLEAGGLPRPEPTRAFLEAPRGEALAQLANAWLHSPDFNELRLLPGLSVEGEWQNDPLRTRQAILGFLSTMRESAPALEAAPAGETSPARKSSPAGAERPYWSLAAFVTAVRQKHPDFQRPAGDYDSWYLRDRETGEYLRGYEHWDAVDGAVLRYVICGPLHWLGILELACPGEGQTPSAFRFTPWANALLAGQAPEGLDAEQAAVQARSDARLRVPRRAPRALRYQIARFCAWEKETEDAYHYRMTPAALERARQQGLRPGHLLALLRRHAAPLPPNLVKAMERWDESGSEARLEQLTVLRLRSPELLQTLRSSRAARFLGDPLGPAAVIVKPGARDKVLAVLVELGYFADWVEDPSGEEISGP